MNVLFLCTGNSCRSILAEATFNHLAPPGWRAMSAGSRPTGQVHPRSLALQIIGPGGEGADRRVSLEGGSLNPIVSDLGLGDDSVASLRLELTFEQLADGTYRFVGGSWSQACQPGRGHQDFSIEVCL